MTVIACNRMTMACDSGAYARDMRIEIAPKIERIEQVGICGTAGYQQDGILFYEWLKSEGIKPVLDDSFVGLVLSKKGIQLYEHKLAPFFITEDFFAIGNGAEYAMGAMELSATPEEAIIIACRRIEGCELPVFSLKL